MDGNDLTTYRVCLEWAEQAGFTIEPRGERVVLLRDGNPFAWCLSMQDCASYLNGYLAGYFEIPRADYLAALFAEKKVLLKMLGDLPGGAVIDRLSLEARLQEVSDALYHAAECSRRERGE